MYRFIAFGAQGAHHVGTMSGSTPNDTTSGKRGGYGARGEGRINLTIGEVIKILVGQAGPGPYNWGGGGGGTFVVKSVNNVPLLCIGGGSGLSAYSRSTTYSANQIKCENDGTKSGSYWTSDASSSEYGMGGYGSTRNATLGYGGTTNSSGGGFNSSAPSGTGGGDGFLQGGVGGTGTYDGGFGGGGAPSGNRAGAGGGWTGGNGPSSGGTGGGVSAGGGTYVSASMGNVSTDREQNGNTTVTSTSKHGYVIVYKI
jgi:hypothetical protein